MTAKCREAIEFYINKKRYVRRIGIGGECLFTREMVCHIASMPAASCSVNYTMSGLDEGYILGDNGVVFSHTDTPCFYVADKVL